MRITKTAKQHRPYPKKQVLSTLFSKNGCCLSILILLFQFFPSFLFLQGGSLVWALRFQTAPQGIDDVYEDIVFSPNGDGVQDTFLISFITDGDLGDFRIIIDTHGPSGVGAPDGHFRIDEDWVITGELGPGIEENDAPKAIREAWDGNDFSRQQEDKNPHLLNDGRYRIQIEIDVVPNEEVNFADSGYRAVRLSAIIDNTPPQLSAIASQRDLSPNGDTIVDEAQINYGLSEDLAELELQFTDPSYRPAVPLMLLTEGNHSFTWAGVDGLDTALSDGIYGVQLHGTDKGGNVMTFGLGTFQIDTKPPTIVQLTPGRNSFQNTPIEQIEALFGVDDGSLIDVESTSTTIVLRNADGAQINGLLSHDEEAGRVTLTLDRPLNSSDDNEVYTIDVSGADKAGNIVRDEVNFTFDNIAPTITSITTDAGELTSNASTTTKFTFVDVTLADNIDSTVNFSASTIRLNSLEGTAVAGNQRQVGENGIRWTPGFSLATDGSNDGGYTITVQSRDRAGNEIVIDVPFIYDTQAPKLVSLTSDAGVQLNPSVGATTFLNNSLSVVTATFNDEDGGVDFSKTTIEMVRLARVGGAQVPVQGALTPDEDDDTLEFRLTQPLERRNGSQDGTYLIRVRSTDKAGNTETKNIELVYDTQAPAIVSTIRTANPLTTERIEVELEVTDTFAGVQGTGVDASASTFELFDANGAMVDGAQTNDGAGRFAFRSRVLPEGGMYTLVVTLVDRAGNRSIPLPLIYDAEEPTIEAVSHIELTTTVSNVSEFLTRLEATVSDVGTGIDFDRSLIQLLNAAGEVVPGTPYHDDEGTIGWELSTPLTREGNFDGLYSVRVSAVDKAGYVEERTFALRYDTQVPIIQTAFATQNDGTPVELSGVETQLITSSINQITVRFSDGEGSGMDVLRTTVSLIGPEGMLVGTNQSDNGSDTVYLSFNPLRADGSDDGFYRVQVTPTDLAGNTLTSPVEFPFFYGTRKPEVITTTPAEFASVTHLTEVSATLQDHSGEGIDFDRATILLNAPDQSTIPGHQTVDEVQSSITWELNQPLSRDGSVDGEYTIQLLLVDKVGNSADADHTFIYDTLIPTVTSVTANTDSPTVLLPDEFAAIEQPFDGLTVELSDANSETTSVSGIDLVDTGIQLLGPGSTPLGINTHDDGVDTITVSFASLYQPGTYTLEITPRDLAGNVSSHAIEYKFNLELGRATVSAVTIDGQMAPVEFVNRLEEIVATLEDVSATGLNLTSDGSTITVTGPNGEVDGVQTSRGENQIAWRPLQLATDGSADGVYTVTTTPVNSGGRLGIPARHQFTLDTQEPEVVSVTPIDPTQPLSYIGRQLIQIAAQVEDVGPAGLEIEDQRLQLLDAGGNIVPAIQSDDGEAQIFLTLSQPLTADGSDDGVYTVSIELTDKADNLNSFLHEFVYDTLIPTVTSVTTNTDSPTVLLPDEFAAIEQPFDGLTVELSDANSETTSVSGIDLVDTGIQLLGPGSTPLGINTHDDGVDTITVSFASLYQPGTYTLEITPRDLAGNVSRHAIEYKFNLELGRATVSAVTIDGQMAPVEFVNRLDEIVATFENLSATGLDLTSDGSTITVTGPNGEVEGVQTSRGENQIAWRPLQLATDGSADGVYTVTTTPVNSGGRLGSPSRYQFTLDTQEPEVVSVTPIDLTQPLSYIGRQLIQIAAQVEDVGPADLDIDSQRLQLRDARGNVVPAIQTNDGEAQIFLTLSQPLTADGSDDGVYTVSIELTDKADNLNSFLHEFVYDTLIPTVTSVTTNTDPPTVLLPDEFAAIEQPFDGLTVELSDANSETTSVSGIDLVDTGIQLLGPGSTLLGINTHDDGVDTITVSFASLYQPGTYTLEITPRDLAGNVSSHAIEYKFNLELGRATVSAVTIDGQMAPVEFVNRLEEIVATFENLSATGLDLTSDGSTITVTGPNGEVEGVQTSRGENQIAWRPLQFATDGSADGVYTVMVTPVNNGGRLGIPARHQFTLDTQEPEVVSVTPIDPTQPLSYIGQQIIQIAAQVEDMGPAGLEVEDQRLQLRDAGGNVISAMQTNDGEAQIFLTLSQPLATDGSDDGVYTVSIELTDKADNLNSFLHEFVYDTLIPTVTSVTTNTDSPTVLLPDEFAAIEQPFDGLTVELSDANSETTSVSGIDLVDTGIQLLGPGSTPLGINTRDDGVDTIIVGFASLYQPGTYTLEITPRDLAGNVSSHAIEYKFNLELGRATVSAVTIDGQMAPVEFVNRLEEIVATFENLSATGLNLTSDGSTITITGPNGEVEGVQTSRGENQIAWRPLQLATDGSADGVYTVTVTPVNNGGRLGIPARHQFTLDTQEPEVVSVTPIDPTQPLSYIGQQIIQIAAQVEDMGPAGLEVEDQRLQLRDAGGNVISAMQTNDGESQIFLTLSQPLATDGSDDGVYTVSIELTDKADNLNSFLHEFVYDTLIPTVTSVTTNTDPPTVLLPDEFAAIEQPFDGLTVELSDANSETTSVSGIDLGDTGIQLLGPGSTPLGINARDDGLDTITVSFASLYQPGTYTLEVTPRDLAGNVSRHAIEYKFNLELGRATVSAVTIDGQMAPVEFVNRLDEIVATFENLSATGLNLTSAGSTITVTGPDGEVEGVQTSRGENQIAWRPLQLATDGSADGVYTVTVTPVNNGGRLGIPARHQFTLDTQEPEVVSVTPIDPTQPLSYIGQQIIQIAAQVEDMGPAGLEVDDQRLQLRDAGGNVISAIQTNDGESQIFLTLSQPLATDGSDDGVYTVSLELIDKAGNLNSLSHQFIYDTLIPTIVSVTPNTNPPTIIPPSRLTTIGQAFDRMTIKLSDARGLLDKSDDLHALTPNGETTPVSGIDLVGTSVQLFGPEDTLLGINTRDDGVDTVTISFALLHQLGTYTLEITPRDLAGNVSRHAIEYKFNLELGRATVSAVTIDGQMAPVEFVNRLDEIVATLEDVSATGLNLTSDGSTIAVTGPDGEVEGVQTSRGENQIAWRPLQLATDGSADGVYTVTVIPVNSGDRLGIPSRHQFTLDTQEPEVVSVTPIDLTQPLSYIGQQLIQIAAQVEDVGPAGLEVEDQRLQLLDPGGNIVPAIQSDDGEAQIFLTLSQPLTADGSDDGVYTVSLDLMDKASNLNLFSHQLVYDTQAPTLVSTNPTDGSLRSDDITLITARLNDLGGSGIDFAESTLTLLDSTVTPINGVQSNDGNRKLTLQISGLVADGNYTIRVEAIDRAGNGSNAPFEVFFTFSSGMPVVVSTVPKTKPTEEAFTNESLGQVSVELQSEDGGVDRSTIALLAPDGTTVPGQQVRRGKLLIYRLLRELATDGSDDGSYAIAVVPINSAGRQGQPEQFTFVYDTVVPEVIPSSIQLIVAEPGVNNSLVSVGALITDDDPSSGVDWDNLDLSWITLGDVTRNRKIDGTLATDEEQALLLNLIMPLASDGSQDGVYLLTIAPKDRAGNVSEAVSYPFFYDTRPPTIDTSSLFIDGQPLLTDSNDLYYPSATNKSGSIIIDAKFSDINPDGSYGLGPDLVNSSISVSSPSGEVITGTTTQDGTDSIRFKSGPLDEQGHYQVTITSVGSDAANLGFQPTDSVTTQFLFETTKPVVELTDLVGETTFEDEPLPLQGTTRDPSEEDIPASEVAMVELVGTGPDGLPIDPVAAKDDSEEEEDPWSRWSIDFLPSQSGEYNLDIRVTDRAGNAGIYDAMTVNFSVSLIFKGPTYVWPNPLSLSRRSSGELAHFSFEVNVPGGEGARIVLSIYDFAGDLVYEKEYDDLGTGRSDNKVRWDFTNQSGTDVARGIYIFRLEAEDVVTSNRTNAVGKVVVVE